MNLCDLCMILGNKRCCNVETLRGKGKERSTREEKIEGLVVFLYTTKEKTSCMYMLLHYLQ